MRNVLAKQWVSYGVGIALGRFNPGLEGALGRGTFPKETAERLRTLSSQDGLMALQKGHPRRLAQRVWEILRAVQGDDGAEQIIRAAMEQMANLGSRSKATSSPPSSRITSGNIESVRSTGFYNLRSVRSAFTCSTNGLR